MKQLSLKELQTAYERSVHRLFFLDYMGTLIEQKDLTDDINPDDTLNELLFQLTSDAANQVVIISEKPRDMVSNFFERLPLTLAAENGGWVRSKLKEWTTPLQQPPEWMSIAGGALEKLAAQHAGSFLERLDFSVRWYYGTAWKAVTITELNQIKSLLRMMYKGQDMTIVDQNGVLVLSSAGVSKGKLASHLTSGQGAYDFILAAGDGRTDEDMFKTIGDSYFTIKIGHQATSARFRIDSYVDFREMLKALAMQPGRHANKQYLN